MSEWSLACVVVLGHAAVVRLLQRAARIRAGRQRSDRAGGRPSATHLDDLRPRVADFVRRRTTQRRRDVAVPAYAEAIARELRAGCSLPEAIALAAGAEGPQHSPHLDVLVGLGAEVGGQLADAFDSLAAALRDDLALRDEVHALTAQSRASAALLTALPFGAAGLLGVLQPSTVTFLLGTSGGRACAGSAVMMLAGGWAWMASMVRSV